jgi:adenylate kinase
MGRRVKEIMARGELVPDDLVVAIVSERIQKPDARNGFILDGFPRTVPQAHALDRMLTEKGLKLDAVIELKVNESALLTRIEKRIADMAARGETLRSDDDPVILRRRLLAYRDQTEPLVTYYRLQSVLRSLDGMASIERVAKAIDKVLAGSCEKMTNQSTAGKGLSGPGKKRPPKRTSKPPAKSPKTKGKAVQSGQRARASSKNSTDGSKRLRRLTKRI